MTDPTPRGDPLTADLLPDSRARARSKGALGQVQSKAGMQEPVYCMSCGVHGGWVPAQNMTFVGWLCRACEPKYGELAGLMVMPDEVFWARVQAEQQATYGRPLTPEETVLALHDPDSLESQLARERAALTPTTR